MTLDLFATYYIPWIVLFIAIDWVLGIITSLSKSQFKLYMVADYLHDAVLPYLFVFVVVEMVGMAQPTLELIVPVTFWLILISLLGSIIGNLGKLGLSLPKWLKKTSAD